MTTQVENLPVIQTNGEANPAALLQMAIQQNVDIDKLEKLMQLQERWEAKEAKKEFFKAMAEFQSICPVILKEASGYGNYKYATLGQIISQLQEPLKNCGLSYRWENNETDLQISVKCIITHQGGHSEFTSMSGKADKTGSKNEIQAIGSTLTYLQRYTLTGALGIGTAQDDIDAHKTPDGKLSPDMQMVIDDCKTKDDLKTVYDSNPDLQKDKVFNQALTTRKNQIANGK